PMLRALDVRRALETRRWGAVPGGGARFRIEVRDPELPENVGPWSVEVEAGDARVTEGSCTGADAALTCGPAAFAQIWTGELAASEAARLGSAEVDDPERLLDDALAVPQRFWLPDEF
ncbi:MAG: sterol carrier protein domain-containing protein, partial [Longimicrobiales bacterium]